MSYVRVIALIQQKTTKKEGTLFGASLLFSKPKLDYFVVAGFAAFLWCFLAWCLRLCVVFVVFVVFVVTGAVVVWVSVVVAAGAVVPCANALLPKLASTATVSTAAVHHWGLI